MSRLSDLVATDCRIAVGESEAGVCQHATLGTSLEWYASTWPASPVHIFRCHQVRAGSMPLSLMTVSRTIAGRLCLHLPLRDGHDAFYRRVGRNSGLSLLTGVYLN